MAAGADDDDVVFRLAARASAIAPPSPCGRACASRAMANTEYLRIGRPLSQRWREILVGRALPLAKCRFHPCADCDGTCRFAPRARGGDLRAASTSRWISSSVRPLVSGTCARPRQATTQKAANSQNVAATPIASISVRKNWLTRNAAPQLTAVATATRPAAHPAREDLVDDRPHDRAEREGERGDEHDERHQRDDAGRGRAVAGRVGSSNAEEGEMPTVGEAERHADQARKQQRAAPEAGRRRRRR